MLSSPRLWLGLQLAVLLFGGTAVTLSLNDFDDAYEHHFAVGAALENLELTVEARIDDALEYQSLRRVASDDAAVCDAADRLRELSPEAGPAIDQLVELTANPETDERWWFTASSTLEHVSQLVLRPTGPPLSDGRSRTWILLAITGGGLAATMVGRHVFARDH